ncbi:MAG: hypothetical protein A3K19_09130 [Lentisphaerae bacterium RIFOXYB12_FULL_65_16]|nr:MAG: hypothetical protein A3K18_14750 [Lentisphaerae bacterium RIFOXYA12_64_32]OGV90348.1 MAG: hypothetical protein A3K19_09130 [Lentisphaerae bacterium RIFOXYB12_FULL_65_16]
MRFEWDEDKRRDNLRKHGLDFRDAEQVFAGVVLTWEDERAAYGEQRFLAFGLLQGRVVAVAYTWRGEAMRLISMRKAASDEEQTYFREVGNGFRAP